MNDVTTTPDVSDGTDQIKRLEEEGEIAADYLEELLDIAGGHPDRVRPVVHPNWITIPAIGIHAPWGTLGLLWDVQQKWDGQHDRPAVVFASPDRFDNYATHVAGLFLPGVPEWVPPNHREAQVPYPMQPDQPLHLECQILADADATDALAPIEAWIDRHGFPEPAALPPDASSTRSRFASAQFANRKPGSLTIGKTVSEREPSRPGLGPTVIFTA